MTIPVKTLKSGLAMPVFGMGTWMMGGDTQRNPDNDGQMDIASLIAGMERGYKHIDTAEMYAEGFAEHIAGQAIKGHYRESLFITTKVWNTNLSYDGVLKAAEGSLKRLGTDYIDLYLIHKPNNEIPLKETIRALDRLQDEGIIKHIGVSNFAIRRFEEAQNLSSHKIVANQVHYNLIYREPEPSGLLEYCQANDIMLIAWRPLQKGGLLDSSFPLIDQLCSKYRKTRSQIAINWLISQPNVVTMSTMRSIKHLEENLGAVGWQLDYEEIEKLRMGFPGKIEVSDVVPLT
jgi:diketogulonate reductase-like aldo/keto reductase